MKENYELIDNEERHQYEFHIERYVPRIEYIKNKDGVIYLTHTEVPWSLEVKELVANWWRKCSWISRRKTYVSFRYVRS